MRPVVLGATLAATAAFALVAAASADAPKRRREPGALVVVIDRSLTMHGARLDAMKAAALASIAVLAPDDQVAVVAFDSEATVPVPLQRPANRAAIARVTGEIRAEGGTNVYAGLKAAHDLLRATTLATRHVIVMTDGDAAPDGLPELIADMREHGETLSILGLPVAPPRTATCCRPGPHAHRTLMSMLAKGSGRLYFVDDLGALARTAAAEVRLALE